MFCHFVSIQANSLEKLVPPNDKELDQFYTIGFQKMSNNNAASF